jgi:site-specific DNA recombinase
MAYKIEYHTNLVQNLEKQIRLLQGHIDQAYCDKLDKKISEEFWSTHSKKWLKEKEKLAVKLLTTQKADTHYLENANLILQLVKKAAGLFKIQNATEKRKLMNILLSNCSYSNESLDLQMKPVFSMIMKTKETRNWCARQDSNLRPTD